MIKYCIDYEHGAEIFVRRILSFKKVAIFSIGDWFVDIEDRRVKDLMEKIDAINGVVDWRLKKHSIYINKAANYTWDEILPTIKELIDLYLEETIEINYKSCEKEG